MNKLKQVVALIFLLVNWSISYSQAPDWQWIKTISDAGMKGMVTDVSGNIYIVGDFELTVDFDPAPGITNLTSVGQTDVYLSKYDPIGNLIWAVSFGGSDYDVPLDMTIDASGNLYLTGYFYGTCDFNPGSGITLLSSNGDVDIFITKFSNTGSLIWAKTIGGTEHEHGYGIGLDQNNNVITTGRFMSSVTDFDPGAGIHNLILNGSGANINAFVLKLDNNGDFLWAHGFGGTDDVWGFDVSCDGSGNIYTAGNFWGATDFDPGTGFANLSTQGFGDVYISKLDSSGNYIWALSFGDTLTEWTPKIKAETTGNVFLTGQFYKSVDFDPGPGSFILTSGSTTRANSYCTALNSSGGFLWAISETSTMESIGNFITRDLNGNIYHGGYFSGTTDFDPGPLTNNITALGNALGKDDAFLTKTDSAGNYLWTKHLGSDEDDGFNSMAFSPSGEAILMGGIGDTVLTNVGTINPGLFFGKLDASFVSLIETADASAISIFPNPVTNSLNIIYPDKVITQLRVIDITGRSVMVIPTTEKNSIKIDVSSLQDGLYFIADEKGVSIEKFVKSNQ